MQECIKALFSKLYPATRVVLIGKAAAKQRRESAVHWVQYGSVINSHFFFPPAESFLIAIGSNRISLLTL